MRHASQCVRGYVYIKKNQCSQKTLHNSDDSETDSPNHLPSAPPSFPIPLFSSGRFIAGDEFIGVVHISQGLVCESLGRLLGLSMSALITSSLRSGL
jgi:hypothetical protein